MNILDMNDPAHEPEGLQMGLDTILQGFGDSPTRERCPDCNGNLIYKENCKSCADIYCGWSKC